MLGRWNQLSAFKRRFLLYYAILFLAATVAYPIVSSQKGFAYQGSLLLYRREETADIYAGKIGGDDCMNALIPLLHHPDAKYRAAAATALAFRE